MGCPFRARIIIEDGGIGIVEVWDDDFSPFESCKRPVREWVHEHLTSCYTEQDLRELVGVPKEGNYEIVIEGSISGSFVGYYEQEWDEEIDITSSKHKQIPDSWYEELKPTELELDGE